MSGKERMMEAEVRVMQCKKDTAGHHWLQKWGMGPHDKDCRYSKSQKGKITDSPLGLQEEMQPYRHLDFSSERPIPNFWPLEL